MFDLFNTVREINRSGDIASSQSESLPMLLDNDCCESRPVQSYGVLRSCW